MFNGLGYTMGNFFHQLIRSPWLLTSHANVTGNRPIFLPPEVVSYTCTSPMPSHHLSFKLFPPPPFVVELILLLLLLLCSLCLFEKKYRLHALQQSCFFCHGTHLCVPPVIWMRYEVVFRTFRQKIYLFFAFVVVELSHGKASLIWGHSSPLII
jgi:hypothetical protein